MELSELTLKVVADADPKLTELALVKPEPATVTTVPPAVGPDAGVTPVTTGAVGVSATEVSSLAWLYP